MRLTASHREIQALLPHRAPGADLQCRAELPGRGGTGRDREKQVRIGG
jgi:hypothetical protein